MEKIEFLRKIKALADRGVGGEKANASKMLDELLAKYGMTMNDIENETVAWYHFKFPASRNFILFGIVHKVVETVDSLSYKKKGNIYSFELTMSQAMLVEQMIGFHRKDFQKQLNILKKAYVLKHELYSPVENPEPQPPMSEKEYRELLKAYEMSENIEGSFRKQIDGPK